MNDAALLDRDAIALTRSTADLCRDALSWLDGPHDHAGAESIMDKAESVMDAAKAIMPAVGLMISDPDPRMVERGAEALVASAHAGRCAVRVLDVVDRRLGGGD
jgi:hypothetical protein